MIANESRWARVGDSAVHYLVEGSEDGCRVVLLHGTSLSSATRKQVGTMAQLAPRAWLAAFLVTAEPDRVLGFIAVAPVGIPEYRDHLARVSVPTLAVWREHDDLIPLEQIDWLVQGEKRSSEVVIAGGTHAPDMSTPAKFHEAVLDFLAKVP